METLIIHIPYEKVDLVKQLLTALGVTFHYPEEETLSDNK